MNNLPIIVLVLLFMLCCNKDNNTQDYRNKFLGSYYCTKTGNYYCGDSTYHYDTTEVINVTKSSDSLINILEATLKLDLNGEFGGGLYPDPHYHLFDGYFKDDSIIFGLQDGLLGCFTRLNYKGIKL